MMSTCECGASLAPGHLPVFGWKCHACIIAAREEQIAKAERVIAGMEIRMEAMEEQLRKNIKHLLGQVGDRGTCKGCAAAIWWVVHKNGKRAPYTAEGLNHFADCPAAGRFKR